jgi:hypothetical protein
VTLAQSLDHDKKFCDRREAGGRSNIHGGV